MGVIDESQTNIAGLQLERAEGVELLRGAVLAGRYQIEAVLGRGGAGVVLRAFDRELREAVAIKVLRSELGNATRWIERLAREVKLARQLRHPNVCRVFDFEKADGHVFIVMELATGGTLRRELDDGEVEKRPLEQRLADASAVAAGLAAIHEAGIAHRDVTPQNVLRMADGRLVVSDFGLATEVSQTTTSIHGGTVAYMAPEIVRGQRASFASDVWSLGVVLHEIVFGRRPTWSKPVGGTVLSPSLRRTLAPKERAVLEICRACTADALEARPRAASEVAAALAGGKTRLQRSRRLETLAVAATATSALVAAALWFTAAPKGSATPRDARDLTEVPSVAADWSRSSRVLTTIPDRIQCLDVLPGGRVARFVWGTPRRSEDVDLRTGERTPSPIVPDAYREGCAELSPDGNRLAFQGYAQDGRAFAYVSEHPDGRDAVPLVGITDPSMSSEPKWLPDGRAFTFDIDHQRMGIFSLDTRRTTVLPEATNGPYAASLRFVSGARLFVAATVGTPYQSEFVELAWPFLTERGRFIVPGLALDVAATAEGPLFVTTSSLKQTGQVWALDLKGRSRRAVAAIDRQVIRYPTFTTEGLLFASMDATNDVWRRGATDRLERVTRWGDVVGATACGDGLIVSRVNGGSSSLVRLDRAGRVIETLASNTVEIDAACSPTGPEWFTSRWTDPVGIYRCSAQGCQRLTNEAVGGMALSPDGARIAFIQVRRTEAVVAWIPSSGGEPREVSASETGCSPGWSSSGTLWVSRRRASRLAWVEIDVETGRETGRTVAGQKDCTDGGADPASPVDKDVRVVRERTTQIRMLPRAELSR